MSLLHDRPAPPSAADAGNDNATADITPRRRRRGRRSPSAKTRRLVWRFVGLSVLAFAIAITASMAYLRWVAEQETLREARTVSQAFAQGVLTPRIDQAVLSGDQAALAELDRATRIRMGDGTFERVKIWREDGSIVYSDDRRLIDRTYEIAPEDQALFGTTDITAAISPLDKDENALEQSLGTMVEVYAGFESADGVPLLFEAYLPVELVDKSTQELRREVLPLAIGAPAVLLLLLLPLGSRLARDVRNAEAEHARLLDRAVLASDLERRRVAQDLHDGVVQDLAGLGYALTSAAERRPVDPVALHKVVGTAADIVRRDVESLRHLTTDIYPADLSQGLRPALQRLVPAATEAGIAVSVDVPDDLELPNQVAVVAYRTVREAMRNVVRHSGASHAWITLVELDGILHVETRDDGQGFDVAAGKAKEGHFGLRLLQDSAADLGGQVDLISTPGEGTTVRARFPL